MKITEVARFTKKPAEVTAFYATILGTDAPPGDSAMFDIDGVTLLVHEASDDAPPPGWPADVDHFAIQVDDLDAECVRLRNAGFDVTGPTDLPWGRSAYLYDPDGKMVELHA